MIILLFLATMHQRYSVLNLQNERDNSNQRIKSLESTVRALDSSFSELIPKVTDHDESIEQLSFLDPSVTSICTTVSLYN